MNPIEQTILYIKDRRRLDSAVILAKTPGVRQVDEEELIGWAFDFEGDCHLDGKLGIETPGRESGVTDSGTEPHLYFHPLPSGCHALGHLSPCHNSDGNSIGLISHCLIVAPRLLRAFHNNILMIHQALVARKHFQFLVPDHPDDVSSFSIVPIKMGVRHTPVITTDLLEAIRDYPGAEVFAHLLSSSINSVCTFITRLSPSIPLINGVIQCLPIPLRPELSFATSLHFSALRPLRLIAARESSRNIRSICRQYAIPFFHLVHFDIHVLRERLLANRDWATLVYSVLERGLYHDFARCLTDKLKYCSFETQRGTPDWNLLNRVSESLFDEWFHDGKGVTDEEIIGGKMPPAVEESGSGLNDENQRLRGDASHWHRHPENDSQHGSVIKETDLDAIAEQLLPLSSFTKQPISRSRQVSQRRLAKQFPQYEREIRHLDSLLARSLFGDTMALESLNESWRELRKRLPFHDVEVIRETYLHLVQSIIVQPRDPEYPKPPRRTIDSLEVMNIFLQE
ncbi:MAG: hypothetical protein FWH27_01490 [Planctomycetaceae bacterium]|nr:hypothetical protein [Planctomycetaceae bacterium]